jgi:aromatic ring-opening dioxygenase LigB subunit
LNRVLFLDVPCGFTNMSIRIGVLVAETNEKYKNNNYYCYYYYSIIV